jgi:hypothetical protein
MGPEFNLQYQEKEKKGRKEERKIGRKEEGRKEEGREGRNEGGREEGRKKKTKKLSTRDVQVPQLVQVYKCTADQNFIYSTHHGHFCHLIS